MTRHRHLSDVYTPGQKVLLHGDGPYTVAGSHRDENDVLVYALEEARGYLWPASEVSLYESSRPPVGDLPPIPTDDTPERLELLDDIVKALRAEIRTQTQEAETQEAVLSGLDVDKLAKAALDAIMKRIMMDLAQLNTVFSKIEEETRGDSS
jgi:hypothetical protein